MTEDQLADQPAKITVPFYRRRPFVVVLLISLLLFLSGLFLAMLDGAGGTCSSSDTQALIQKTLNSRLENQYQRWSLLWFNRLPPHYRDPVQPIEVRSLQSIRTMGRYGKNGHSCRAHAVLAFPQNPKADSFDLEFAYTVEVTDKRDEIIVRIDLSR